MTFKTWSMYCHSRVLEVTSFFLSSKYFINEMYKRRYPCTQEIFVYAGLHVFLFVPLFSTYHLELVHF